jgi:parallel beta-helix repeat protein
VKVKQSLTVEALLSAHCGLAVHQIDTFGVKITDQADGSSRGARFTAQAIGRTQTRENGKKRNMMFTSNHRTEHCQSIRQLSQPVLEGTATAAKGMACIASAFKRYHARQFVGAQIALAIVCSAAPLQTSLAADWWVSTTGSDSNPGSSAAPFRSIQKAANVVKAGDTVRVLPGVYLEKVVSSKSGTASARIRYVSTQRWGAKLTINTKLDGRNWSSYTKSAGWYNTGNFVDIDGFEIYATMGSGGTLAYGIYNLSSNTRLVNNKVHDISASPCKSWGGGAIVSDGWGAYNNVEISNNIVFNVGDYAGGCVFVHGIYHTTTGPIINNLAYRISGGGIHLWHAPRYNEILNNTVFNTKTWGIVFGADPNHTSAPADYAIIANNIVYDTAGVGMASTGYVGSNNIWTNNLVFKNRVDWQLKNGNKAVNTIVAAPGFLNYNPDGGGNYKLGSGSPAINAGAAKYAPPTDLDAVRRDSPPDLGSYEYVP